MKDLEQMLREIEALPDFWRGLIIGRVARSLDGIGDGDKKSA